MSDQPRLINIAGRLYGPTPEPPSHLRDIDRGVADAAWRQSNGSIAAYHMLLDEHLSGAINLLSKNPMRLTAEDAPEIAGGDPRYSATGGEVYGGPPGTIQTVAPGMPQAGAPRADQVSPLSESERNMLAELRAKPEVELSQSEAANLRALTDRETAIERDPDNTRDFAELQPLTVAERDRLSTLRAMPEAELTQPLHDEMADLIVREGINR